MTGIGRTTRRGFLGAGAGALAGLSLADGPAALPNEFFALDTALVRNLGQDILQESDVEGLAALGYAGLAPVAPNAAAWQHLKEHVTPWLDARKLKLYAVYSGVQVARDSYTFDPELKRNLPWLKGRGAVVWLPIVSKAFQPSAVEADTLAVAAVREVADLASEQGPSVSLYPHVGNLAERVADVVRIAEKSGRANVGVTFNLCHWLRTDGPDTMQPVLKLALPRLSLVTINGANRDGKGWADLIQPLDRGTFDLTAFLGELHALGYRGPIGLQGYAVAVNSKIDPGENLRRSMAAWRKLARAAAQPRRG